MTGGWACSSGGITHRGESRSTRRLKKKRPFAILPNKYSIWTVLEFNQGLRGKIQPVLILVFRSIQRKIWRCQTLTSQLTERGVWRGFKRENAVVKSQCYVIRGNKTTSAAKFINIYYQAPIRSRNRPTLAFSCSNASWTYKLTHLESVTFPTFQNTPNANRAGLFIYAIKLKIPCTTCASFM